MPHFAAPEALHLLLPSAAGEAHTALAAHVAAAAAATAAGLCSCRRVIPVTFQLLRRGDITNRIVATQVP